MAVLVQSCTIVRITGNGNIVNAPCTSFTNSVCYSEDGVQITVKGFICDYTSFVASGCDKTILLSKGYRMSTDYDNVIFTHPKYY